MDMLATDPSISQGPARAKQLLPALKDDHGALDPIISARTMYLHHDVHHASCVDKLNAVLEQAPALHAASPLWLLCNLDKVPGDIRDAVHHNAGGHVNHSMFWRAMRVGPVVQPACELHDAIEREFGDFDTFKARFEEEGEALSGSGWVWLAHNLQNDDRLEIITTSGHDHPMMEGKFPLLLNDVWEHACYPEYESRRAEYLKAWWHLVDRAEVALRFERKDDFAEQVWETDGGRVLVTGAVRDKAAGT